MRPNLVENDISQREAEVISPCMVDWPQVNHEKVRAALQRVKCAKPLTDSRLCILRVGERAPPDPAFDLQLLHAQSVFIVCI